jgi:hypothetical protein
MSEEERMSWKRIAKRKEEIALKQKKLTTLKIKISSPDYLFSFGIIFIRDLDGSIDRLTPILIGMI